MKEVPEYRRFGAKMAGLSPVFEPPGAKRARKTGERVLGEGHHAEITFKLAVVHIHKQLVGGELVITAESRSDCVGIR